MFNLFTYKNKKLLFTCKYNSLSVAIRQAKFYSINKGIECHLFDCKNMFNVYIDGYKKWQL